MISQESKKICTVSSTFHSEKQTFEVERFELSKMREHKGIRSHMVSRTFLVTAANHQSR